MNERYIRPEDRHLLQMRMIDMITPYSCPYCAQIVKRRYEGKYCTRCGTALYPYRYKRKGQTVTLWVSGEDPSCKGLVKRLVEHIRKRPNMQRFQVLAQQWEAELGMANALLRYCEGNMQLAETVVDMYFDHDARMEARDFRAITSMAQIINKKGDIATMLGIAKDRLGYSRRDLQLEAEPQVAEMF